MLTNNDLFIIIIDLNNQINYIIILATVITNLLSAIPFIGGDLVPLSIILSLYLLYIILILFNKTYIYFIYSIKKVVSPYITLRFNKINKLHSNSIPSIKYIENINKNLLALIVGFIDGDGYIRITKKSKSNIYNQTTEQGIFNNTKYYIYISLIINLNKNELELLQYFHKHLDIGKVYNITPKKGNKLARWEINKTDLFNKLEPLLEYHNIKFLTETRQKQYLLLKYIKYNNLIYYEDINKNNKYINEYINNNKINNKFNKLDYFNNWFVGFTMAEGLFLIKKNNDICFQIKQKYNALNCGVFPFNNNVNLELFNDITKIFNTTRKLNIINNKYIQFNVSSKKDIQNIINFFSFSNNHPLLGNKLISYNKWLLAINNSIRYKELKTPYISIIKNKNI